MTVVVRCVACGSSAIRFPPIQAPEGYAFDAHLTLVTCDCGRMQSVSDCTVITGDAA